MAYYPTTDSPEFRVLNAGVLALAMARAMHTASGKIEPIDIVQPILIAALEAIHRESEPPEADFNMQEWARAISRLRLMPENGRG